MAGLRESGLYPTDPNNADLSSDPCPHCGGEMDIWDDECEDCRLRAYYAGRTLQAQGTRRTILHQVTNLRKMRDYCRDGREKDRARWLASGGQDEEAHCSYSYMYAASVTYRMVARDLLRNTRHLWHLTPNYLRIWPVNSAPRNLPL